jgi:hypothetical protein
MHEIGSVPAYPGRPTAPTKRREQLPNGYRPARAIAGEASATSPDDMQLRRDVPEGRQLGRLEFQGNQRLDGGWVSIQ